MAGDDYRARLITARERLGLSPAQMAKRLLTPRQTYSQWEDGRSRTPGAAVVAAEMLADRKRGGGLTEQVWALTRRGRYTAAEVAEKLGASARQVEASIQTLRRRGEEVPVPKSVAPPIDRELVARAAALVRDGWRISDAAREVGLISHRQTISDTRVGHLIRQELGRE